MQQLSRKIIIEHDLLLHFNTKELCTVCFNEIIAEIKRGTGETHDGADERFRDKLQLDKRTGDLTIKNSTAEDTGCYNLNIRSRKGNTDRTYSLGVIGESLQSV